MKLKRVLSFIAVLLLALTIVACKKTEDDPAEEILDRSVEVLNNVIDKPEEIKTSFGVPSTMVDGVTVTWASSEPGVVTFGEVGDRGIITAAVSRPSFEDGDQKVTITATLTVKSGLSDDNITRKWEKELTVIAFDPVVGSYSSFTDAYNDVENGTLPLTSFRTDILIFDNVSYHGKTSGGFFFATQDGALGYVHGTANLPQAGVKGELKAKVYNYFGFLQLDDYEFVPEDGTTADYEVDYVEMTNDDINELPLLGSPFPENMSGPSAYKLKNVMLYVDESIDQSRYNLVILPFGYDFDNAERNEAGDLHYEDSILVYYTNLEFDQMKLLSGLEISELDVIYEGYRDDRHVKYVTILGLDNIKLAQELTDENKVAMAKTALSVETEFPVAGDIELPAIGSQGATIEWDYVDETNTNNSLVDLTTGKVTMPAEGRVSVKIVATITVGQVEDTKEFEIKVGSYVLETVADALAADNGDTIMISGVVTDKFGNNTYGIQDTTGAIALFTTEELTLGKLYTIVGTKAVYEGLPQLSNIEIEKEENGTTPAEFAIDDILGNETELAKHIAKVVSVTKAEVLSVTKSENGNIIVRIKKNDAEIDVRYDNRVAGANTALLESFEEGDLINFVGNLGWFKGPQLGYGPNAVVEEYKEPVEPGEETTVTAKYPEGSSSKFSEFEDENNATIIGLDEDLFEVLGTVIDGGSYTNPVGLNTNGTIRLYSNRDDGQGNKLTINVANGLTITGIKIVFVEHTSPATSASLVLGNRSEALTGEQIVNATLERNDLSINTFSLQNTYQAETGSNQIHITSIEITYFGEAEPVEPAETFTVTFDSDGGSAVEPLTVEEGKRATQPANPTKDEFVFVGWFIGEDEFDFGTPITADITLTAKWLSEDDVEVLTIAAARAKDKAETVVTKGVVTAIIGNNFFIQDETAGVYVYIGGNTDYKDLIVLGNEVQVSGAMTAFSKLIQIETITDVKLTEENKGLPAAVVVETLVNSELLELESQLVTVNNAVIKTIPTIGTNAYTVVVTVEGVDLQVRIDQYITDFDAVKAHFEGLLVGQKINLINVPMGRYNDNPQAMPSTVAQIVAVPLTDDEKAAIALADLSLPEAGEVVEDIVLPMDGSFDAVVSWTASEGQTAIVITDGVAAITRGEENVTVTLSYSLVVGESTPLTGEIEVIVLKTGEAVEQVIYETGFEASDGFEAATAYNNTEAKEIGGEGHKWTVLMGTPTTTQAMDGAQTIQMRYYYKESSQGHGLLGELTSGFKLELTKLEFDARWHSAGVDVKVSYSTDNENWTDLETYELTNTKATFTADFTDVDGEVYVKFSVVLKASVTSGTPNLLIDNLKLYGLVE